MDRWSELHLVRVRSLLPSDADGARAVVGAMIERSNELLRVMPASEGYSGRRDAAEADRASLLMLDEAIVRADFDSALAGIGNLLRGLAFDGSSPDYFSMDDLFTFDDYDD